jgi:hypothetical protein
MNDQGQRGWRGTGIAGALLVIVCSGCDASLTNLSALLDADQAEATASSAQTTAALGSLALEATLNQIDPANFAGLSGPPVVNATGDATSGTVTVDIAAGTEINNASVSGSVIATYLVTGGTSVSITVSFPSLTANTSAGGAMTIDGSLTLTATLNGTSNIAGSLTGSATTTVDGQTTTVTPDLTFAIDGTPTTGNISLGGDIGIDSSLYGDWTATLTSLTGTISQATRVISEGAIGLARNSFPPVSVTMLFTAANSGTLEVSPFGFVRLFTL